MTDVGTSYRVRLTNQFGRLVDEVPFGDRQEAQEYFDKWARLLAKREAPGALYFIAGNTILRFTNGRGAYGAGGVGSEGMRRLGG